MSKEIRPQKSYTIQLTTLTPVCIGNGGKMVSTSDYVFDKANKQIHYINKEAVAQKLANHDELMDKYIQGIIYGMDNNVTRFDLKNFLEKTLSLSPKEYISYSVTANIKSTKDLNTIIKDAKGSPYIPGSTIKGALKNAMAYRLVDKKYIEDFAKKVNHIFIQFEREITGKSVRKLSPKTFSNLNAIKSFEKELKLFNQNIDNLFVQSEKNEEGKVIQEIAIHNPLVSDSEKISSSKIKVVDIKRVHLHAKDSIPIVWESIPAKISTTFQLKLEEEEDIHKLFQQINNFTFNNISSELETLDYHTSKTNDNNIIISQLEEFQENIEHLSASECILRIGFNKGFYFNSIADLLYNNHKEVFEKFLILSDYVKYKGGRKIHPDEVNFPLTRGITPESTLGWVKLEII